MFQSYKLVYNQIQRTLSLYRINLLNDTKIWKIDSNAFIDYLPLFNMVLSDEERYRASRIVFEAHRRRFIIRKALLRIILGALLGFNPREIEFYCNKFGKPFIKDEFNNKKISFNISHSDELFLIGITQKKAIGVDIEKISYLPNVLTLSEMICSEEEMHIIKNLPEKKRNYAFFSVWVQKEAISKAIGMGMSMGFSNINVNIFPEVSGIKKETIRWWQDLKIFFFDKKDYFFSLALKSNHEKNM